MNVIAANLATYGLDQCFITFYKDGRAKKTANLEWSLPESSRLMIMTDKSRYTVYHDDGPVFKTKELIPAEFYPQTDEPFIWVVYALFSRDIHFGNIIFTGSKMDPQLYITIQGIICSGLMSVYLLQEMAKHTTLLEDHKLQLEAANEKLTELDRMKTDFIQNMTHEFRSPLSIIMNSADLALKYDQLADKQSQNRFSIIYDAALKLNSNIDKLLDLSKMDSNKLKTHITPINLGRFLDDIVDFYKSVASLSHIQIESDLSGIKEVRDFYNDRDKLEDIINNVFSNALKFADQKAGQITVNAKCEADKVQIIIKDNGIGIEKGQLEKIFERFVQVESGQNSRFKGSGIGLAFARQLTELLQGKIWADSEGKNKGTTFFLEFPRGRSSFAITEEQDDSPVYSDTLKREKIKRLIKTDIIDAKTERQQIQAFITNPNKEAEFDYKKAVILIVEDNRSIQSIEQEYLEKEGYTNFILAQNGLQGIEAIHRYHPDLVLCDFNMPGLRGDQLHDRICNASEFKHLPFIFITAVNSKELIKERKQKGAIAYLVKPVEELELIVTVNIQLKRYMDLKESLYMVTVDQLTGLANKKALENKLKERLALRKYRHLALIFMDIDFFKAVNDTYGHQVGDEVLRNLGAIISSSKRDYDIAGRYGGEEFLLILPETNQRQALEVAKKLKDAIANTSIKSEQGDVKFTASFGISSLIDNSPIIEKSLKLTSLESLYNIDNPKEADWEEINNLKKQVGELLLKLADNALYDAKSDFCGACGQVVKEPVAACPQCHATDIRKGRNRIVLS
jgi:diguanylate cyclase (GGDEF)-like protein